MGNEFLPEMPQFRQPDGRTDWRQVADMFIPGNVWNSRTDAWRPRGMVAGAASTAFGPLGGALVEATEGLSMPRMPQFSGWLRGRTGRGADTNSPSQYGPRRSDVLPRINAIGGGSYTPETVDARVGSPAARDVVGESSRPAPMRNGVGGYGGHSWSSARGLGEGQRRSADQIMQEQMEFLERSRNRRGALMER